MANDTEAAERPTPQPPEGLHRAVVAEGRRRLHRRRLGAVASVVAAFAAAATISAGWGDRESADRRVAAGATTAPSGAAAWVETSDPVLGWHFEHPASWSLQRFSGRCRIRASGSVVTNLDRPLRFESRSGGCTTAWDLHDLPAGFVGVQISHYSGGAFMPPSPDTAFPLDASAAELQEPLGGDGPRFRIIPVSLGGNGRYSVVVWEGRAASAQDRERIDRIVSSIRPGAARRDPGDGNRQVTPGVVVLEGTVEGVRWELVAYDSDRGVCADLRFWRGASGGCGFGIGPERPVGVSQGDSSGGPRFVHGVARADVVGVRVALSDGSTIDVPVVSASGFDVRFWATPLPPSLAAAGVVAKLRDGTEVRAR